MSGNLTKARISFGTLGLRQNINQTMQIFAAIQQIVRNRSHRLKKKIYNSPFCTGQGLNLIPSTTFSSALLPQPSILDYTNHYFVFRMVKFWHFWVKATSLVTLSGVKTSWPSQLFTSEPSPTATSTSSTSKASKTCWSSTKLFRKLFQGIWH